MTETVILRSSPHSEIARPLIDALIKDYDSRYGHVSQRPGSARAEVERYPAQAFTPPFGDFLLLQRDGQTVAGGAFMSHDNEVAEIKRVWTHPALRRQGLARQVMIALEESAATLGYSRAYLTTGFLQPEAVSLYLSLGYRPLFDLKADPALYRSLPFEKMIGRRAGEVSQTPVTQPAASFDAATDRVNSIKKEQARKIEARLALHQAAE